MSIPGKCGRNILTIGWITWMIFCCCGVAEASFISQGVPCDREHFRKTKMIAAIKIDTSDTAKSNDTGADDNAGTETETESTDMSAYLDQLNLQEIQKTLTQLFPEEQMNVREMLGQLFAGELPLDPEDLLETAKQAVLAEAGNQRKVLVQILLLAVAASVFNSFIQAFDRGQVQEIAFYVVYLLLFALLLQGFHDLSSLAEDVLGSILQFMRLLLPVYLLAGSLAAQPVTSLGFYEATLFLITVLQSLVNYVILPGISCYVLLGMLNHLSRESALSRLIDLLKMALTWILRITAALVAGVQTVQRLLLPALDSLKSSVWIRAGSSIPVLGNTFRGVTETVLGTAVVLRNAIGVLGLLVVELICFTPMLRLLICLFLYRAVSAAVQPLSDARFTSCIDRMADGIGLLLMAVTVTAVLFLVTLAMATAAQ